MVPVRFISRSSFKRLVFYWQHLSRNFARRSCIDVHNCFRPVYLPKAKRHQSLPPSCNLDETGTAASMKTVGGGDSCGRYAMVNDESAAVKESVGCKASSANVVNMQSKLVSSATAFSGHVHNSVIPPQQSNPPHTYVNGATTVIKVSALKARTAPWVIWRHENSIRYE